MTHYFELKVLFNIDVPTMPIMNIAFNKLHMALVRTRSNQIGVSFPNANKTPGDVIRIHGQQEALQELIELGVWSGMLDFVQVSKIARVPEVEAYVRVSRVQPKFTAAKLRRSVRRGSLTEKDAEVLLQQQGDLQQSFLCLSSSSTGQKYPLFFEQRQTSDGEGVATFNSFGFTNAGCVPMF